MSITYYIVDDGSLNDMGVNDLVVPVLCPAVQLRGSVHETELRIDKRCLLCIGEIGPGNS